VAKISGPSFFSRVQGSLSAGSLGRAAREILIVTIGILIAFGLNTWWENRQAERQEQEHLRALKIDFERNRGQLEELVKAQRKIAANSRTLLSVPRHDDKPPAAEVRNLMHGVFSSRRFEPVMGAYEALVNSAGLPLVRNDKLRGSLARFAASVNGRYGERFGDEIYFSFVREFAGRLQFAAELAGAEPSSKAYTELLEDPKFLEYLAFRGQMEGQIASQYESQLRQCDEILKLLEQEIQN